MTVSLKNEPKLENEMSICFILRQQKLINLITFDKLFSG